MSEDTEGLVPEPEFAGMRELQGDAAIRCGEVLARYMAVAYLEDGDVKRQLCFLLTQEGGVDAARYIMRKKAHACRDDCVLVLKELVHDLANMPIEDVWAKPYRYVYERWFYADPAAVPKDDPHWQTLSTAVYLPKQPPEPEPSVHSIFEPGLHPVGGWRGCD